MQCCWIPWHYTQKTAISMSEAESDFHTRSKNQINLHERLLLNIINSFAASAEKQMCHAIYCQILLCYFFKPPSGRSAKHALKQFLHEIIFQLRISGRWTFHFLAPKKRNNSPMHHGYPPVARYNWKESHFEYPCLSYQLFIFYHWNLYFSNKLYTASIQKGSLITDFQLFSKPDFPLHWNIF